MNITKIINHPNRLFLSLLIALIFIIPLTSFITTASTPIIYLGEAHHIVSTDAPIVYLGNAYVMNNTGYYSLGLSNIFTNGGYLTLNGSLNITSGNDVCVDGGLCLSNAGGGNYTSAISVDGTTTKTLNLEVVGRGNLTASWTDIDTDTTYSNGSGLILTGTAFSLNEDYTDILYFKNGSGASFSKINVIGALNITNFFGEAYFETPDALFSNNVHANQFYGYLNASDVQNSYWYNANNPKHYLNSTNAGTLYLMNGSGANLTNLVVNNGFMFLPDKPALRVFSVTNWTDDNIGIYSVAVGLYSFANGTYSIAMGNGAIATSNQAIAIGGGAYASGAYSLALGPSTFALGENAVAIGPFSNASGQYSQVMGYSSLAAGQFATSIGFQSIANGISSFALGRGVKADGYNSYAFGRYTNASGSYSYVLGRGASSEAPLVNSQDNSLVVGWNSTILRVNGSGIDVNGTIYENGLALNQEYYNISNPFNFLNQSTTDILYAPVGFNPFDQSLNINDSVIFADIHSLDWTNITLTKSQISDFGVGNLTIGNQTMWSSSKGCFGTGKWESNSNYSGICYNGTVTIIGTSFNLTTVGC